MQLNKNTNAIHFILQSINLSFLFAAPTWSTKRTSPPPWSTLWARSPLPPSPSKRVPLPHPRPPENWMTSWLHCPTSRWDIFQLVYIPGTQKQHEPAIRIKLWGFLCISNALSRAWVITTSMVEYWCGIHYSQGSIPSDCRSMGYKSKLILVPLKSIIFLILMIN